MATLQPAPKKLYFAYKSGTGGYTNQQAFIDLSLAASVANRRFYRQGLNWAVANVKVTLPTGISTTNGTTSVEAVQNTWIACNAWKKSFALWQKMNRFAMAEAPSVRPKFYDYKVFFNQTHYNDWKTNVDAGGYGYQDAGHLVSGTLGVRDGPGTASAFIKGGEWDMAKFIAPKADDTADVDQWYVWMHGADASAGKSIISGYATSRAFVTSPEPDLPDISSSWMVDVMNQGTDQTEAILDDLENDNDETPYDQNEYPGGATNFADGETVGFSISTTTNQTGIQSEFNTGPFNAQCGLIKILSPYVEAADVLVEVTLVPGGNRGYLTQGMGDVQ